MCSRNSASHHGGGRARGGVKCHLAFARFCSTHFALASCILMHLVWVCVRLCIYAYLYNVRTCTHGPLSSVFKTRCFVVSHFMLQVRQYKSPLCTNLIGPQTDYSRQWEDIIWELWELWMNESVSTSQRLWAKMARTVSKVRMGVGLFHINDGSVQSTVRWRRRRGGGGGLAHTEGSVSIIYG